MKTSFSVGFTVLRMLQRVGSVFLVSSIHKNCISCSAVVAAVVKKDKRLKQKFNGIDVLNIVKATDIPIIKA